MTAAALDHPGQRLAAELDRRHEIDLEDAREVVL